MACLFFSRIVSTHMKLRSAKKQVSFNPIIQAVYIRGGITTRQVTLMQEQAKPSHEPHRMPRPLEPPATHLESAMRPLCPPWPSEHPAQEEAQPKAEPKAPP